MPEYAFVWTTKVHPCVVFTNRGIIHSLKTREKRMTFSPCKLYGVHLIVTTRPDSILSHSFFATLLLCTAITTKSQSQYGMRLHISLFTYLTFPPCWLITSKPNMSSLYHGFDAIWLRSHGSLGRLGVWAFVLCLYLFKLFWVVFEIIFRIFGHWPLLTLLDFRLNPL